MTVCGDLETTLTMVRGTSPIWTVTVRDPNNVSTDPLGEPVDITGYSIWFTAKSAKTDADPGEFQLTVGSGITISNQVTDKGEARISPPPSATSDMTAEKELLYDVQVQAPSGWAGPQQIVEGVLVVTFGVKT